MSGVSTSVGQTKYDEADILHNEFYINMEIHILKHRRNKYQYLLAAYPEKVIEEEPQTIDIPVKKTWNDDNNAYGNRPGSITVKLYKDGVDTGKSLTLNSANGWSGTFSDLEGGTGYTVRETSVPTGYTSQITGSQSSGFTITNTLQRTSVKVTKSWNDDNNRDGKRPSSIRVTLCENGTPTSTTATLSSSNGWTYTFSNLPKYKNGSQVSYSVQETAITDYTTSISGNGSTNVTITNTHVPERTQVTVTKQWNDDDNLDDLRPSSITVTLYKNGTSTGQTVTLSANNNWTASFTNLYKYENGRIIDYTVRENSIPEYTVEGNQSADKTQDADGNTSYTLRNTHEPYYDGYVEITGRVWLDGEGGKANDINGVYNSGSQDELLSGIIVRLKDANGNVIPSSYYSGTGDNITYIGSEFAETAEDGTYTIRVNYDNSENVYKLYEDAETVARILETAYVEFEYDGMLYTTVASADTGENTSKATENESQRNTLDRNHSEVDAETEHPDNWTDKNITAITKSVTSYERGDTETRTEIIKYCNGNGRYDRTKYDDPTVVQKNISHTCENCEGTGHTKDIWTYDVEVEKIINVNLGLFRREQPDVAIFSDLTKVQVTMNGQGYTYLYGVRSSNLQAEGNLQAQFQNKDTYTYRRPVNPSDIAYIQEDAHSNAMSVLVTYQIKVANLSTTLRTTIHNIANYFDEEYTLNSATGWSVTGGGTDFKQATYSGNITLEPQRESTLEVTYTVSLDAIRGLLNEDATLNNAVEITRFSTQYGESTLYAEQRTGGRTGNAYAGYDYNSHPGNANIRLIAGSDGVERLYSTDANGNIIAPSDMEDDTDIAPSFVLCLDAPTTVAGIVWEDSDTNEADEERIGDGRRDDSENKVENVKIEVYEVNSDGTIGDTPATLYNIDETSNTTNNTQAILYTGDNGEYQIEGLVTGLEYIIRYTYGNDSSELDGNVTTIGENVINARNYKSTIITDPTIASILEKTTLSDSEKMWPITHEERYSVAVDNMEDRLNIEELKNSTYGEGVNITAYTKPFILPVELTTEESGDASDNGDVIDSNGQIIANVLNKFDFGIIERPRENLIVQKTISYFKITLANGQVLTEGDPSAPDANISYVKPIGFQESTTVTEAMRALQKMLLVEMDAELIQGAQLEVTYAVKVTNNNEIDYDYGDITTIGTDYTNYEYIAIGPKASYYYYGESSGLEELASSIKYVDYLDTDIVYNEDENTVWTQTDANTLNSNGYIHEDVKGELNQGGYRILQTNAGNTITIARGESTEPVYMTATKLLARTDENVYDNHAEIIEIDGKTGRTIKGKDEEGRQIEYTPGNYRPSEGPNESDDDSVNITITPPTGITNYITTYVIAGLVGLVVVVIGIIFIKKKVIAR